MWTCKKCNTVIEEDNFDICWNCQNLRLDVNSVKDDIQKKEIIKEGNKMKIILSNNLEQSENTNHEPNDKRAYLNKLKEKIQQRTTQQADNLKNELSESNVSKELVSDLKEIKAQINLFQGIVEAEKGNAKFPEWDIVPTNQFINPRIKPQ